MQEVLLESFPVNSRRGDAPKSLEVYSESEDFLCSDLPHVYDLADHHARLRDFSFSQLVEE